MPRTWVQVGQRRPVERGRRVDEHVAASVPTEHRGRGGPDRVGLGEVHGRVAVPVEDHDLVPGRAQANGDRTADGPGSPGDRCHARHGPKRYYVRGTVLLRQDTAPSWFTMVDRGATTMWEYWAGVDSRGVPHGSLNHYSKGAVATFLHRYVAGLRPAAPGYRRFEVRPRPGGGITWASTRHVGPFGQIDVTWRVDGGSMELDVLVPGGTTATAVMPGTEPHDVGPGQHRWTGAVPTG